MFISKIKRKKLEKVGKLLTGEFNVTLDEKNRMSLPFQLRRDLDGTVLRLTKGLEDNCLWLFPADKWEELVSDIVKENTVIFSRQDRSLMRRLVSPSIEVEIDKVGRIPITPKLREWAGLTKECLVMGQLDYA